MSEALPKSRELLLVRYRKARREVVEYFATVEYWNAHCVPGDEIEADPGGALKKELNILNALIFNLVK